MSNTKKINKNTKINPFVFYKNKPLVRCDNVIYYGNLSDKYVIKMEVKDFNLAQDLKVSSKVLVQMMETDFKISDTQKILKVSEKNSLYSAIDIAQIWLKRYENLD